jgi:hypothetical protein
LLFFFAVVLVFGTGIYAFRAASNPPGFFVDESSIAYNAHTISQTGRDEFGKRWPLFFRAFGDYKNPVYIYLLATLFKLTGPSILTARLLSAAGGVIAAALLGLLALRISRRHDVGLLVIVSALLTPWLFEISRVSLEVALNPPALAMFLLCVHQASTKTKWTSGNIAALVSTLALLTYTYSIGRLLAPLLALGLGCFLTRQRLFGVLRIWALYALSLIPMFVFQRNNPEALTGRFKLISYFKPGSSAAEIAWAFLKHYAGNLDPRRLLITGDPGIYQVAHVAGAPAMLAATVILTVIGIWLVLRHHRNDAWWRFVIYGLLVSVVPASLTADYFHMLRLAALPVFLLVLIVPAIAWLCRAGRHLRRRRTALVFLVLLTLMQGALFQRRYHASAASAWRRHLFDADYPQKIFDKAITNGSRPIYLADAMTTPYIQAYWYATLKNVPLPAFVRLAPDESPPPGALVISTEESCFHSQVLAQVEPYTLYVADRQAQPRAALPDSAMRAGIGVPGFAATVFAGEKLEIRVRVRNDGDTMWAGCERSAGRFHVSLGSHWLNEAGQVTSEAEGRTPLPADLAPGQEMDLRFALSAPSRPGEYVLELDMLQEGVSWFALKGSPTWRAPVRVQSSLFR